LIQRRFKFIKFIFSVIAYYDCAGQLLTCIMCCRRWHVYEWYTEFNALRRVRRYKRYSYNVLSPALSQLLPTGTVFRDFYTGLKLLLVLVV